MKPRRFFLVASLIVLASGCGFGRSETLTIATTWTLAQRSEIDKAFQEWSIGKAVRLRWIALTPSDEFITLVGRNDPPDLILGAPGRTLRRLKALKRLETTAPPWWVARRSMIAEVSKGRAGEPPAFDDFRHDPISLEWAASILAAKGWIEGYGDLVRKAGVNRPPGHQPLSAFAAFERGEVDSALTLISSSERSAFKSEAAAPWDEGLAIIAGSRSESLAREFVRDLAEAGKIGPPSSEEIERSSGGETLLADLLSAFVQDVEKSRDGAGYDDRAALLDYCSRSANPVGRLLLHLYGVHDAESVARRPLPD